jgi:putative ATP-dependent endonuclease of the OLD family
MDVDNFLVELNGSGIREALRLILDTTFEEPDILLVEEPEIHLHPGLETAMMRFLKEISKRCQVCITTHSTNFLDSGDYQRVYLVTKPSFLPRNGKNHRITRITR